MVAKMKKKSPKQSKPTTTPTKTQKEITPEKQATENEQSAPKTAEQPQVQPPAAIPNPLKRKRGRPPGSKTRPLDQASTAPAAEPIIIAIDPAAFVPIAMVYSAVLSAFLPPKLTGAEQDAISQALAAVAAKYGPGFRHWEIVALATALVAPLVPRIAAKAAEREDEKTPPPPTGREIADEIERQREKEKAAQAKVDDPRPPQAPLKFSVFATK
jgi:hypothetical protein